MWVGGWVGDYRLEGGNADRFRCAALGGLGGCLLGGWVGGWGS